MKLLLDENLPHELRHLLVGHSTFTATYMGWSGLANGELLKAAAEDGFDAMLTMDSGIPHQQNPGTLPCSVVMIKAKSNAMVHLAPLVPQLLRALQTSAPKSIIHVRE
jgi:hypothetical protein